MPKVEHLPSGSFRIRYTDPWGRQQGIVGKTAGEVNAKHRKILGDMARGEYVDPKAGKLTVAAWADLWLAGARNLSRGGHDTYRRDLDRHILPALGRMPIGKVTAEDIDAYLNGLSLAASSIHRHYRTLHRMFAVAVDRGRLARNPCQPVEPPRVTKVERTALTMDQVDDLADAITARYRAWVFVMAYGGLRWSESIGLRRANVDVATLRVIEQLIHRGKGEWERVAPKTGSRRTITLPDFAADELATHLDTYSLPGPDGLVFPTRNGTPPQAPSFSANTFRKALVKAKLPRVRVHDLRHTAVSLALDAGANPKVSQVRAGHRSSSLHHDTYGHRFEAADVALAARLGELRAESRRARLKAV